MRFLLLLCLIAAIWPLTADRYGSPFSLSALAWTLSNANGSVTVRGANVPGYALDTLASRGIIGDPLFR